MLYEERVAQFRWQIPEEFNFAWDVIDAYAEDRSRLAMIRSTDGGRTWSEAALQEPVLSRAHTRFRWTWTWDGSDAILQSRCTDETGYVQPARAALTAVRGVNSNYHNNAIQSWNVAADGAVTNGNAA